MNMVISKKEGATVVISGGSADSGADSRVEELVDDVEEEADDVETVEETVV